MNIKIIPMESHHIEGVALVESSCFTIPWSIKLFADEMRNPNSISFVAVDENDRVIGFVNAHQILDEVYLNNIAVLEEYRGYGISKKLLVFLEIAVRKSVSFITLEVRKSNIIAISLYENLGYKIVGQRNEFYTQPTEPAILMTKFFS